MHIGIKGIDIQQYERPTANLVFLLDVSGSMDDPFGYRAEFVQMVRLAQTLPALPTLEQPGQSENQ